MTWQVLRIFFKMRASIIHFNIPPVKLEKFHTTILVVMEAEMV